MNNKLLCLTLTENRRLCRSRSRAFTIMEIVISLFVLTVGLLGILAVFPVGMDHARRTAEKTNSVLLADSVFEYLQVAPELAGPSSTSRFPSYDSTVASFARTGICEMENSTSTAPNASRILNCTKSDGSALNWPSNDIWKDHMLLILSGRYRGKLYRILSSNTSDQLTMDTIVKFDYKDEGSGEFITAGTSYRILGKAHSPAQATDNVIPGDVFNANPVTAVNSTMPGLATTDVTSGTAGTGGSNPILSFMKLYGLEKDSTAGNFVFNFETVDPDDTKVYEQPSDYTWACAFSEPDSTTSKTVLVAVMVYKAYKTDRRPDDPLQKPPVDLFISEFTKIH